MIYNKKKKQNSIYTLNNNLSNNIIIFLFIFVVFSLRYQLVIKALYKSLSEYVFHPKLISHSMVEFVLMISSNHQYFQR